MTTATILLVEDEMVVALDIQSRLERAGYLVPATALSGEEAIAFAEEYRPDLILMDIGLQGRMDGIEAALIIRERLATPVIFLRAYADEKSKQRAGAVGPVAFLTKPFKELDLLDVVETALRKPQ